MLLFGIFVGMVLSGCFFSMFGYDERLIKVARAYTLTSLILAMLIGLGLIVATAA